MHHLKHESWQSWESTMSLTIFTIAIRASTMMSKDRSKISKLGNDTFTLRFGDEWTSMAIT